MYVFAGVYVCLNLEFKSLIGPPVARGLSRSKLVLSKVIGAAKGLVVGVTTFL